MRFDDRLLTVLRKPVTGDTIARIQYRQLLDLLGTSASDSHGEQIDAAYLRLAELSRRIPVSARVEMLHEPFLRLRSARLVAQLAEAEPSVASAAVAAAQLSEEQWLDLIPALPIRARGIVRHRRGLGQEVEALLHRLGIIDRGLPSPPHAAVQAQAPIEGIGAIVRRIEQFRKTRQQHEDASSGADAPRLPLGDGGADETGPRQLQSFDFATDAEGRIVWSEPAAAPMSVGLRLAALDPESPLQASPALAAAFRQRQPVRSETLKIAGAPAIAGTWQADAAPRFDRPGGRFVGYCGRMRRPAPQPARPADKASESDSDRMRQILHELRTPVNAIQGFAEVIQQQLFGPTPHEYRALAANIASDSARMLAGFEELDRLVRLDGGALDLEQGDCDIAAVIAMTVAQLRPYTAPRGSDFVLEEHGPMRSVAMARPEAERLIWRLFATLASAAAPGEQIKVKIRPPRHDVVRIIIRLPALMAARDDDELFHAGAGAPPQALSAGTFGAGFALRLAAAEARAAGGMLERRDDRLRLSLPEARPRSDKPSIVLDADSPLRGSI